jgi:hypothetical protein
MILSCVCVCVCWILDLEGRVHSKWVFQTSGLQDGKDDDVLFYFYLKVEQGGQQF